ncbi:hypothetical protein QR680_011740 [Steinernema hermaphroditum]|uniref:Tyrosine-protein kinase n=1 Tax=Steinernema hermaphroditum TaxID=289476 RepID=A0AA39LZ86_9BILA|nr:hypothetical protein QR680_011740 [Steinernema hermaphroditum]
MPGDATSTVSTVSKVTRSRGAGHGSNLGGGGYENEEWYHGLLPREDITKLLTQQGHFLVRQTEPRQGQGMKLVLSVKWNSKAHHFIINENCGKIYIERYQFDSVNDLIRFYTTRKVAVTEKSGAQLLIAVPKQDWELRHEQVDLGKMLGEGAFGGVYAGTLTMANDIVHKVAVKVHKGKALNKEMIKEICKEARIMRRYEHPNIVRFYGVAIEHEPIMLVMELVNGGSLDSFLVKKGSTIGTNERVSMCYDAAKGLEYLHDKGCIHRDVAARNCLVQDGHVKISDFGLSREMSNHEAKYKLKNLKQKLPIRWLAPETLITASYSSKSDVFSYGIMMWEVFTDGADPYPGMTVGEVNVQVKSGYRMAPPDNMPTALRVIMSKHCFPGDPHERWSMTQIRKSLEDLVSGQSSKKSRMGLTVTGAVP